MSYIVSPCLFYSRLWKIGLVFLLLITRNFVFRCSKKLSSSSLCLEEVWNFIEALPGPSI